MKYSLVELAPVTPGQSKHDAIERALRAAEEAERLGYHRIWYAEHHHARGYASQDPAPLIAAAAQRTARIRIGSGAVLLNHHSPYTIAERFLMLQALAPGRVDLGIGRSSAGPLVDLALRRHREPPGTDDFAEQVEEVVAHLHRDFAPEHPFSELDLTDGIRGLPQVWVLGSSGRSSALAGRLGLGYTFGGHINPALIHDALDGYRASFTPTAYGTGAPQTILGLFLVAADDEHGAHRLTWPARALRLVGQDRPIPTLDQAARELTAEAQLAPSTIRDGVVPAHISGTAETLRAQLEPLVRATGAHEIMVQDMLTDAEPRRRSRELIAEALAGIDVPD